MGDAPFYLLFFPSYEKYKFKELIRDARESRIKVAEGELIHIRA